MRSKILELIQKSPYWASRKIAKDPQLSQWVLDNTLVSESFPEMVLSAVSNDTNICPEGNKKSFNSLNKGWGFCADHCKCYESHMAEVRINRTLETKDSIQRKRIQTTKEKYGVENVAQSQEIKNKTIATNLERYAVEYATQSQDVRDKTKSTNLERYGHENPMQSSEVQESLKRTLLEKYGVEHTWLIDGVAEKSKQSRLEKYGAEHALQIDIFKTKQQNTCLEKYGETNTFISHKEKIWETNQERYGVKIPSQLPEIQDKIKATNLVRYGHENIFLNPEFQDKYRSSNIDKFGRENVSQRDIPLEVLSILHNKTEFEQFVKDKTIKLVSEELNLSYSSIAKKANEFNCKHLFIQNSYLETKVDNFLRSLGINFIKNTRKIISPKELDFYLPDHNLAIECHGLYWHSELSGKDKFYHLNKWKACQEKGIKLLQYFEDELNSRWEVIENKLKYELNLIDKRVGARQVKEIRQISFTEESDFLNLNHIQGSSSARSIAFGAFYLNELIGVISLRKVKGICEVTRFATKLGTVYSGLFSKMLKFSIKSIGFSGEIISFSDNRHGSGALYKATGFSKQSDIGEAYFYTKDYTERLNRQGFMKSKIQKKFNLSDDDMLKTEWQLMQELDYDRIWDAGKIKWVMIR
jgi:hypothetical protein